MSVVLLILLLLVSPAWAGITTTGPTMVPPVKGGTGIDTSASTGYLHILTGAWSVIPTIPFTDLSGSLACSQMPAFTGDVTSPAGSCVNTIPALQVTNAMLANSSITIQGLAVSLGGATLATTSAPQFARLGLGQAADSTIPLFIYTSGTPPALSATSTQLVIERNSTTTDSTGLTFISGATGAASIRFGTSGNQAVASIVYDYNAAAFSFSPTLSNAQLTNSSVTIAGHTVSLGGSQTLAASDLTNGTTGSGAVVLGTSPTISGTSTSITNVGTFALRDTSAAFDLTLAATSSTALTAGRTLIFDVVNAARTIKLTGNPTLADWFDQSVKTTAGPTFAGATLTAALTQSGTAATISSFSANGSQALTTLLLDASGSSGVGRASVTIKAKTAVGARVDYNQGSSNIWSVGAGAASDGTNFEFYSGTGAVIALTLLTGGNVGVGRSPGFNLDVNGTLGVQGLTASGVGDTYICWKSSTGEVRQGATCAASVRAIKHDIQPLTNGVRLLDAMAPVQFTYRAGYRGGSDSIGFIAEDMAAINPRFAVRDPEGNLLSYDERAVLAVTVQAVRELTARVRALERSRP
jgi:hypothetical protein